MIMSRGSNLNMNLENRDCNNVRLEGELELLLLQQQLQQQQQRNRNLLIERERDFDICRSGSAPPTVEGALSAVGSLFNNPNSAQINNNDSSTSVTNEVLTEEEIRSHPAYLAYYYSNGNHNPRLPPPLLSREDWRVAQRVGSSFGGRGDWRNKNVVDHGGSSLLFSMQPAQRAEDELMELRKAATSNLLKKSASELLNQGTLGISGAGMGLRRKSFADIVQEGGLQSATLTGHLSRPASRNSLNDNQVTLGVLNAPASELQTKVASGESLASSLHSPSLTSRTLDTHLVGRTAAPGIQNTDSGVSLGEVSGSSSHNSLSSGVSKAADVAASLAALNMSKDQFYSKDSRLHPQHLPTPPHMGISDAYQQDLQLKWLAKSRAENLTTAANYADFIRENGAVPPNVINSAVGYYGQQNLPRKAHSSASLHSQVNHPHFASLEDWHSHNFLFNNHHATGLALQNANRRRNPGQTGSNLYPTLMDPHHVQELLETYNQQMHGGVGKVNPHHIRNGIGASHGQGDLTDTEIMYLETLLAQQKLQYQSPIYRSSGLQQRYHGDPRLNPYQGNQMANSVHPVAGSRNAMYQNERLPHLPSMKNSNSTGSWHLETQANMERGLASTLLEELKNNKRSLELSDVLGHLLEFSTDQYGSRFIQQKLETATLEEKMKIFPEIMPHSRSLMTDVFGNYVIQKFLEHGTENQRKELASQLIGHVLPLSLQMYGCRVIQKALEVVDVEQQTKMVAELDGSVMKCVRDQNGNHVIQKCIECVPQDQIQFIVSSFFGQVVALSMHPYGCRVIQRVLEHCDDPKTQSPVMDEIMPSICTLAQDQYGNYVIQHVLKHGKPHERSAIINQLAGQIVKMSQQKFASNVVEKCLTFGSPEERQILVTEMLGSTDENEPLQAMMKDPFGNYVVQKILETCDNQSREYILSRIKVHLNTLKKYTYGKHIVSRVEKLITAGEKHKDSSS